MDGARVGALNSGSLLMRLSPHWLPVLACFALTASGAAGFRAGAAKVDITPPFFPVIVNGGFLEKEATKANDLLHARALVLDDGAARIAICVVDTCLMPRELIDEAKEMARQATGIPAERMLVSATHTHTAPSVIACLGTRLDKRYAKFLPGKIAEAIADAAKNLAEARVGWAVVPAWEYTNCRRWIRRPDKMITDPFGVVSARANMHPGYQNPDAIGPAGPIDPDLSLLSVQNREGKPLALLANFSMHYFGAAPVSADYFGKFASGLGAKLGADDAFVGIMSQGTSGDSHWMDYSRPKKDLTSDQYAEGLMTLAAAAYGKIEHHPSAPIAMAEAKLKLRRRVADAARLEWARKIAEPLGDRVSATQVQVYAREQLELAAEPERELKLQALRIGGLGITAIPNEVYAITGLKLKAQSPLQPTFNIELANGGDGYIPPPEQHKLGGYTTWAARTAGLVPEAEPRIVETVLALLERVSGQPRRALVEEHGNYAQAVLAAKPLAYWRMNEFGPPTAVDASGNGHHGSYDWERGVAFHLLGAGHGMGSSSQPALATTSFSGPKQLNRSPHFAGGSMKADLPKLGPDFTVSFWLWNGLDPKARALTGIAFQRGPERLGITGTASEPGRLFFASSADAAPLAGKSEILFKDWHHVALVREARRVSAYLDGKLELAGDAKESAGGTTLFLGGRAEEGNTLEGKIDEAAVFNRALSAAEIAAQYQASGPPPRAPIVPVAAALPARVEMPAPSFTASYETTLAALKPASRLPQQPFSGKRLTPDPKAPGGAFSVSFWFRNDLDNRARPVTAYLFSRGPDGDAQAPGDHLGIGGTFRPGDEGRLLYYNGNERKQTFVGKTPIAPGSWNHAVVVRDAARVTGFLNGQPEFAGEADVTAPNARAIFLGARCDNFAPLQGSLAEFALFERALNAGEVTQLFKTVALPAAQPPAEKPAPAAMTSPPLSPEESLRKVHVPAGFKAELVAAEPLLLDPVAFDWDERGRLWVVEMADYPLGMDDKGKPGGRVRVLEDSDGDGRYDKSTLFAEGLNFPNGMLTWRDGVLVTAAPNILFLRDTNGDGRADDRQVLVSGLQEGNQQLRANGLRWGLDNWVYVAAGGHHGKYGVGYEAEVRAHRRGGAGRQPRFPLPPRHRRTGAAERTDAVRPQSRQLGPLVRHAELRTRSGTTCCPITTCGAIRMSARPRRACSFSRRRIRQCFPRALWRSAFTASASPAISPRRCSGMILRDRQLFPAEEIHAFACEPFHNLVQHARVKDAGVIVHRHARSRRKGARFLRERRSLVPPSDGPRRPRWRALDRGHVSLHDRASAVAPA